MAAETAIIGTLTFHRARNYGAALQTYALQRAIEGMGYATEVVDYLVPSHPASRVAASAKLTQCVRDVATWRWRSRQDKKFASFLERYVAVGVPVARERLESLTQSYRALVVGSDQVWNRRLTSGDTAYFLDFPAPSGFKRSYATSMGACSFPEQYEAAYASMLHDFSCLCVRERSAQTYLSGLLNRDVSVACDPTLLLERDQWEQFVGRRSLEKAYVLVYAFGWSNRAALLAYVHTLAERGGLAIVVLQSPPGVRPVEGAERVVRDAGPIEFLELVAHADAVVTDSFHGCCFSVLFERDVHWYPTQAVSYGEARIADLLDELGLAGCRVQDGVRGVDAIDWTETRIRLQAMRERSLGVLGDILAYPDTLSDAAQAGAAS